MASAQLMEEELQHSVVVSEPDIDAEMEDEEVGEVDDGNSMDDAIGDDQEELEDEDMDAEGEDDDLPLDEDDEEQDGTSDQGQEDLDEDDDEVFEDDAEGEEDDEANEGGQVARSGIPSIEADEDEEEDEEDEDDEGVGAVKIKPGETDEDDESENSEASRAGSVSDGESDGEAAWEDNAENEDEEEEESDNAPSNPCMFCKEDEENDPSDEFETYLTCVGCGENAHQQCARENNTFHADTVAEHWKCPECAEGEPDEVMLDDVEDDDQEVNGVTDADASPSTRRATAPKLARDLLPSQRGAVKPDSHSVFNQLVLDEDPMDGSRVLRKRKTSSAEADEDIMSLRKRRKNTNEDLTIEGVNGVDDSVRPNSARSLRLKAVATPRVAVVKQTKTSLTLKLRVDAPALRNILSKKPKGEKKSTNKSDKSRSSRPETARSAVHVGSSVAPPFVASTFSQPFYSFFDKETDELKGKPYGGILSEGEADTSKTLPSNDDRRQFDEAKQKAEEEWRQRVLAMQVESEVPLKKSKKNAGPATQIECIEFGGCEIDTWYAAPYPEEYSRNRILYICEFCLKYMNSAYVAWRHKMKCPAKHPPGDEIYRYRSVSIFEVDGRKNPVYCQNLCLLAKLFLGSKTLYYDVEPFLFYVLCEYDDLGYHFVGYFSKEKRASSQNNVSCILTLPNHQRKGYGNLLIDFSYLLTRVEKKTGSPEKPLSDMGLVSYRNYWRLIMCRYLLDRVSEQGSENSGLSIKQISDDTGLTPDDVISALEGLRCLVREPQSGLYAFRIDLTYCREYVARWEGKKYVTLDETVLTWTPYVMGRSNATNFELGPALTAIAPREEEEEPKTTVPAVILTNGDSSVALAVGAAEANGVEDMAEPEIDIVSAVIESTEPEEIKPQPDGPEEDNDEPQINGTPVNEQGLEDAEALDSGGERDDAEEHWTTQYNDIPPTRFVVFPPVNARRVDRPRPTVVRLPVSGTSTAPRSRPRPRRPSGGARRSSGTRPKSSSSRRKTGGTGRGPGRWPKGTKKSDYGNASSGPGLPPLWVAERARLSVISTNKKDGRAANGEEDEHSIQNLTPDKQNGVNGTLSNRGTPRSGKMQGRKDGDGDIEDVDMEDVAVEADDE